MPHVHATLPASFCFTASAYSPTATPTATSLLSFLLRFPAFLLTSPKVLLIFRSVNTPSLISPQINFCFTSASGRHKKIPHLLQMRYFGIDRHFKLQLLGSSQGLDISCLQHLASALYALFGESLALAQFAKNAGFFKLLFVFLQSLVNSVRFAGCQLKACSFYFLRGANVNLNFKNANPCIRYFLS